MSIGKNIRTRRRELRITQQDLASGAGVSVAQVHKVETGVITSPRGKTLQRMAKVLDTTVDDLVGSDSKRPPSRAEFEELVAEVHQLKSGFKMGVIRQAKPDR